MADRERVPSRRCGLTALTVALSCLALLAAVPAALAAKSPALRAGAGRADITPPTGYAFGGWTRADRIGHSVHTRLYRGRSRTTPAATRPAGRCLRARPTAPTGW
jgi:hypothetical protein